MYGCCGRLTWHSHHDQRGLQALGIVAPPEAGALPQLNERRSVRSEKSAFSRPTTSWPSIERRAPAAARQPPTPRRRRRTAPSEREPSLSRPSFRPPSSTRGTRNVPPLNWAVDVASDLVRRHDGSH